MFQFKECEKVIIFGSSKNLITANYWKKKEGHAWVMMNQAWKIRRRNNDFDRICTNIEHFNYSENADAKEVITQLPKRFGDYRFLDLYITFKKMYGDKHERGNIIFFHTCYYVLEIYDPKIIGFIGCDMDYDQYSDDEDNSFYGKSNMETGDTIYTNSQELILEKIKRFEDIFSKRGGKCYNLSTADWTLLPFEKMNYEAF